mmetsp:Transcript_9134/g.22206  ORF Transcript_9134/g.22206 Transcript_9134/m.22206 type:complete len:387 (-) Transcript_9134:131-1291(-)
MIRSISCCRSRLRASARSNNIQMNIQRRLFGHDSIAVTESESDEINNNSYDDDKRAVLNTILSNDSLRHSMVYSLAMASSEGSDLPPLSRCLTDREREQIRISSIQRRNFRTECSPSSVSRDYQFQHNQSQQRNQSSAELDVANMPDDSGLPSWAHSWNEREEELNKSQNQLQDDRMAANKQIYGDDTIGSNTESLMTEDYEIDSESMAYSLSFASSLNEGSVRIPRLTRPLNERESSQLRISKSQLMSTSTYPEQHRQQQQHLPRTLEDALLRKSEAIVITETEKPFRVFNVNAAWEGLCGYKYVESKGKSLGALLGGKETDQCAVTALIHQLFVHGEEATTVLTNYTKEGRKFRNRLSVGPLYDEETGEVSHFVGVLKEVSVAS